MRKIFEYLRLGRKVPRTYRCARCKKRGVKLWREYQTFEPTMLCCDCAAKSQKKDISDIDEKGMHTHEPGDPRKTDTIGWMVPAVPDEEGLGFWGYTSVPTGGLEWWRRLPTR